MTETDRPLRRRYRDTRRRLLVDMQVPDWDPRFLSEFDPRMLAEATERTGADGAMVYFHNHLGLCFWPTGSGAQHRAFAGRDPVREALAAFAEREIPVCAYYSLNFNNQAWLDHPDWRIELAAGTAMGALPRERYGIVCLNRKGYRAFVAAQVEEILGYGTDAIFFDMLWWNGICGCAACGERWGAPIPERIDWTDPVWLAFQAAREGWLAEFATELRDRCKTADPAIDVYANFALGLANWTRGYSFATAAAQDFVGGDFYGGRGEQTLTCRLMLNLSEDGTPEFMTTVQASLIDQERLRPPYELAQKARASVANGAAMLIIAAIDPIGTLNPAAIEATRDAFAAIATFEGQIGGRPIEDVALYCSDLSRMDPAENDVPLSQAPASGAPDYPHAKALAGACRILEQGHVPFGVITGKQLGELARYPVLVLADIARMTEQEEAAFRDYVQAGGKLYASGRTLASIGDLTGCRVAADEAGAPIYLRPEAETARQAIAPERYVTCRGQAVRLAEAGGEVLARLTLPYGYPERGTVLNQHWASIHSSPPWCHESAPTIVRARRGGGEAIGCATAIEAGEGASGDRLFLALIRALLPAPSFTAEAPPSVALTAFRTGEGVSLFLLDREERLWPDPIPIRLRLAEGERASAVTCRSAALPHQQEGRLLSFSPILTEPLTEISIQLEDEG